MSEKVTIASICAGTRGIAGGTYTQLAVSPPPAAAAAPPAGGGGAALAPAAPGAAPAGAPAGAPAPPAAGAAAPVGAPAPAPPAGDWKGEHSASAAASAAAGSAVSMLYISTLRSISSCECPSPAAAVFNASVIASRPLDENKCTYLEFKQ